MPGMIGLDFETYGGVDLNKHGLYRYITDKTFQPLIGSVTDPSQGWSKSSVDFVYDSKRSKRDLRDMIGSSLIVAHNAPFEHAVLDWLGLDYPTSRFIDSAVVARAAGAGPRLEAAAPQLLGVDKMAEGKNLIKLFSVPGKYQEENGNLMFDRRVIEDNPHSWFQNQEYCELDSYLGVSIVDRWLQVLTDNELEYSRITHDMNRKGWPLDLALTEEMQRRYLENIWLAEHEFRVRHGGTDLNLNSLKQLKEWCADRGIRANSFDKDKVESLIRRIQKKVAVMAPQDPKRQGYWDVLDMLNTKRIIGGSSLKKLQVILDTAIEDAWHPGGHRVMDQYVHCGAGQTWRTTGRSIQMQNLKRLEEEIGNVDELLDAELYEDVAWDNDMLAANLRQLFVASDRGGRLIVGDFSSVESRGLAYEAGAKWKCDAFRAGLDMYKVGAERQFGVAYDAVTKEQRQFGKVGELSCGYGAGPGAVKDFAAGMGVHLEEAEAAKLVADWRAANPEIVSFWWKLDDMMKEVLERAAGYVSVYYMYDDLALSLRLAPAPRSLVKQTKKHGATLEMRVTDGRGDIRMRRYFHGVHLRGKDVCYYKPSERKTGDLWRDGYVHPKSKQYTHFKLYGGKLSGILTQSFCRELFMQSLLKVHYWTKQCGNLDLIGQFHDEIVLDWRPGAVSLSGAKATLGKIMSDPGPWAASFPLAADIKDDYRYTK